MPNRPYGTLKSIAPMEPERTMGAAPPRRVWPGLLDSG